MVTEQQRQELLKILSYVNKPENMANVIEQLMKRQGIDVSADEIRSAINELKSVRNI